MQVLCIIILKQHYPGNREFKVDTSQLVVSTGLTVKGMFFLISLIMIVWLQEVWGQSDSYGIVDFRTSCNETVNELFNRGVSKLYSFWYGSALEDFIDVLEEDPNCCIAYFMAANTKFHPIWDFISDKRLEEAQMLSQNASECITLENDVTRRESEYIDALAKFTDTSIDSPENRLQVYANALRQVFLDFGPTDENAAIFYSLSLLAVGYYSETEPDVDWPNLRLAGLLAELVTLGNPHSPGALHYVIHSYDQPSLASRALSAANVYLNSSVSVPHAIHMPSHIFCDLGMWEDSILSNILSMNTAVESTGNLGGDWYHGAYFLQFSMLQLAMDCDARVSKPRVRFPRLAPQILHFTYLLVCLSL